MCEIIKYKDEDLIGKRFGRLIIYDIFYKKRNDGHNRRWCKCKCDCGNDKDVRAYDLFKGNTKSCGCYAREKSSFRLRTHNLTNHKLYGVWVEMIRRCYNVKRKDYINYGARGIIVCEEWKDVENFMNWCLKNGWSDSLTIDRIDVNGNYEPNNVRFVNRHIQCVNQRLSIRNKSGYKGVSWSKLSRKWKSYIQVNRIQYELGSFKSKREALEARNRFIIENGLTEYKIQEWKGE